MIIIPKLAIKKLVEQGSVDVWRPAITGTQTLDMPPEKALAHADELFEVPEPRVGATHAVRRKMTTESVTRARAVAVRPSALQLLTYQDALAAGFKTRDDFFEWWRARYRTHQFMATVPCWVATYEHVSEDEAYLLGGIIIPGKQGDYVKNPMQARDDLEAVDASEWAEKAEQDRIRDIAHAKLLWRMRRRRKRAA